MNVVSARISNVPGRGRGCEHGQCWETGHIMSVVERLISEVVQSRRRPLLGPSPG